MSQHRTTPDHSVTGMPGGVPYIIGNEAAERFSFYGMRAILTVFMTKYLVDAQGQDATLSDEDAKGVYHLFVAAAYFTPMIGALISDIFWGKYKTILIISLMYCLGHGMLALMDVGPIVGAWDMEPFLYSGLFLIALGAGGIKPCVSAHVGDQFGTGNKHLMTQVFNWFYFSINVGAAASQLATPWLLDRYGPWLAFGLPGVLMGIATFVFWLGRHQFIHVPPAGWSRFRRETFSPEGIRALKNLSPLFLLFVPMFWAIFDQTGGAWVIQGDQLDRNFLGVNWLPSQIQFVNPVMILIGIPIFTYLIYPAMGKFFKVTPLRKIGIGLVLTSFCFFVSALVEQPIQQKQAAIGSRMYTDLAPDISAMEPFVANPVRHMGDGLLSATPDADAEEDARAADRARLIRAILAADASAAWEVSPATRLLGTSNEAMWAQVSEEDRGYLLPDSGSAGDLSLSDLAAKVPDTALASMMSPAQLAELVAALGSTTITPEGETEAQPVSDLASAVKIARLTWGEKENGKFRADEKRIIDEYLNEMPSIGWQFLAYLILTSAEIMVSIVCLEFAYSQSPRKMKSLIMGVYFLGVSLGNFFVSGVNFGVGLIEDATGANPIDGANYYWFFGGLMLLTSLIYIVWAPFYKGETFIQGEEKEEEDIAEAKSEAYGTEHG
ncbi:MAG: POT family MFS transporter [Planctomycetota bacterium]